MSKELVRDLFLMFNPWWGKAVGLVLGYLFAGPPGAVFGALLGNLIDKSILVYLFSPRWNLYRQEPQEVKNLFIQALYRTMGHIAKSDGKISQADIEMAREIMREMRLFGNEKHLAMNYYNEGKQPHFHLGRNLHLVTVLCRHNPDLAKLFVETIFRVSKVDGLHPHKQQQMNIIFSSLGFKPIYDDSGQHYERNYDYKGSYNNPYTNTPSETVSDFALLGVTAKAKKNEIKRAYRKKMSKIHPDKLIAQGASPQKIKEATIMTQKIQAAYERIKKAKGF